MASAVFMFAPQRPRFFSADDWCIEFCILFIPCFLFPIPMFCLFCQNLWAPFTERLPTTFACFCTATLHNSLLYHHLLTSRNPVRARSYKFKKRKPCHSVFFRRNISEKKKQRSCFRWYLTYLVCAILNILCKKFGILFEFSLNLVWLQSRGFGNLIITPAAPFWRWIWNKYIYSRPFSH